LEKGLEAEFFAKVRRRTSGLFNDLIRTAFRQDFSSIDDVGTIGQAERLTHIVVGDQDADATDGEMADEILDVADRDRIDAGKGFRRAACSWAASPARARSRRGGFTAGQRNRRRFAQPRDVELIEQRIELASRFFLEGSTTSSTARIFCSTERPRKIEAPAADSRASRAR